jgi:hypothetical protein
VTVYQKLPVAKDKGDNARMAELTGWENFYVIVGSSAGALIGLQFVLISLIAQIPVAKDVEKASGAFATPTIVHFVAVLILSADIAAPWHAMVPAATLWGLVGLIGITYVVVVARRMKFQTAYMPEFEDRLFHVVLPLAAYATLFISSVMALTQTRDALFAVAAAALILLLAGIHNAWDAATYHVFVKSKESTRDNSKVV